MGLPKVPKVVSKGAQIEAFNQQGIDHTVVGPGNGGPMNLETYHEIRRQDTEHYQVFQAMLNAEQALGEARQGVVNWAVANPTRAIALGVLKIDYSLIRKAFQ